MSNRHRHADLIHAWAEGAEIEHRILSLGDDKKEGQWVNTKCPDWRLTMEYRIKPEKKPDVVKYFNAAYVGETIKYFGRDLEHKSESDVMRLTYDGETGKLIKAEVL